MKYAFLLLLTGRLGISLTSGVVFQKNQYRADLSARLHSRFIRTNLGGLGLRLLLEPKKSRCCIQFICFDCAVGLYNLHGAQC